MSLSGLQYMRMIQLNICHLSKRSEAVSKQSESVSKRSESVSKRSEAVSKRSEAVSKRGKSYMIIDLSVVLRKLNFFLCLAVLVCLNIFDVFLYFFLVCLPLLLMNLCKRTLVNFIF